MKVKFISKQINGIGKSLEHGVFTLIEVDEGDKDLKDNGAANGTKPKDRSERQNYKSPPGGKKKKQ